jgi:hypothetical protein
MAYDGKLSLQGLQWYQSAVALRLAAAACRKCNSKALCHHLPTALPASLWWGMHCYGFILQLGLHSVTSLGLQAAACLQACSCITIIIIKLPN